MDDLADRIRDIIDGVSAGWKVNIRANPKEWAALLDRVGKVEPREAYKWRKYEKCKAENERLRKASQFICKCWRDGEYYSKTVKPLLSDHPWLEDD